FFFSSRRRHTRFSRDWSSDVCSSDLNASTGEGTYSVDSLSTIDRKALCGLSRFAKPAAVRSALIKLPTFSGNCACTPEKVILQTKTVIREYLLMRFITFFDICPLQSNLI